MDQRNRKQKTTDPALVFDSIFGGLGQQFSGAAGMRKSVLDNVLADVQDIQSHLGQDDRARLDVYLTQVRSLEQQITEQVAGPKCPPPPSPAPLSQRTQGCTPLSDNVVVLFTSELADGDPHDTHHVPLIVTGNAGGALQQGRVLDGAGGKLSDAYVALLGKLGVAACTFGDDGTMPLAGL